MKSKPWDLSVSAVIRDARGRCLLLKRAAQSKRNAGKWEPPGGKVEPGEGFAAALHRELFEETGLKIILLRPLSALPMELPHVNVVYLVLEARAQRGNVKLSAEHDGYVWAGRRELAKLELVPTFKTFFAAL
jgi:8-oxo-dGTP diphosphatase